MVKTSARKRDDNNKHYIIFARTFPFTTYIIITIVIKYDYGHVAKYMDVGSSEP
jgi:hypothetical protein